MTLQPNKRYTFLFDKASKLAYVIAIGLAVAALVGLVWAIDLIWP